MSRKGFLVKVELDVQKVSCPGVWLCSNGKVSLQIHMLDSSIQTLSSKPVFPISCYEKFIFYKTFLKERRLNELQRSLNNEWFYAELIQWQSCDEGCVLATFQTTLDDLLYPTSFRGSITGMDIDLLMEPTKIFPGKIAPKLEVSTKTTVEETLCELEADIASTVLVSPKLLLTAHSPPRKSRPRKVCHTVAYSRAQKKIASRKSKPLFQYRKVEDDLILRNNPNIVLNEPVRRNQNGCSVGLEPVCRCYCNLRSRSLERPARSKFAYRRISPENIRSSSDDKEHRDTCSICSKYEGYFSPKVSQQKNCINYTQCVDNFKPLRLCSYCKKNPKYHIRSINGSPCLSDISENSNRKVCFCVPEDKANSLAQQLHEKLSRTLDTNSRFFHNCINCED